MGLFTDMMTGFVHGLASATADGIRNGTLFRSSSNGLIEGFCQELGWAIDERDADRILLHFADPSGRLRKVSICADDKLMSFCVYSAAAVPSRRIPAEIMGFLLHRNSEMSISAWQSFVQGNGDVGFALACCLLVQGMDAGLLKYACESMVQEVASFDTKLQAARLL